MTSEKRDEGLLRALKALSMDYYGSGLRHEGDWVAADSVRRHGQSNGYLDADLSAVGAGLILARLAREGRCLVRFDGMSNVYRIQTERE